MSVVGKATPADPTLPVDSVEQKSNGAARSAVRGRMKAKVSTVYLAVGAAIAETRAQDLQTVMPATNKASGVKPEARVED